MNAIPYTLRNYEHKTPYLERLCFWFERLFPDYLDAYTIYDYGSVQFGFIDGCVVSFLNQYFESNMHFNFTVAEMKEATEKFLKDTKGVYMVTPDTFTCLNHLENEKAFLWLNTPVIERKSDIEVFKTSLTSDRRRNIKKVNITGTWEVETLGEEHIQFSIDNFKIKWETMEDYRSAISQFGSLLANQDLNLSISVVNRVEGKIKCIFYYIKNPWSNSLNYQGVVKDESYENNNIGKEAFWVSIEMMHAGRFDQTFKVEYIDPTCKTSVGDESYDTYKRAFINKNQQLPTYYGGAYADYVKPPCYFIDQGWLESEEKQEMYKGL